MTVKHQRAPLAIRWRHQLGLAEIPVCFMAWWEKSPRQPATMDEFTDLAEGIAKRRAA